MEMLHEPEFWVAVGFVLVIALLLWKGVPAMVGKMLDQRAAVISAELEEAKRLRAEAAAVNEIRGLAADAAVAGAEKLIAARMDAAKASKLIQDSIAGLDKLN